MKKFCLLLSLLFILITAAGCNTKSTKGSETMQDFYVRTDYDRGSMTANFLSTENNSKLSVEMEKIAEGDEYITYKTKADPDKFDRVYLTRGKDNNTIQLAFNKYIGGYHISGSGIMPFVYDEAEPKIEFKRIPLKYKDGDKDILVWTPESYDENDKDTKYSVIYMPDGQNLFVDSATSYGCWGVAQSVKSMMAQSDNKCIIVGIETYANRNSDLTPDIGEAVVGDESYKNGAGIDFSNFVCDTVVPYIEENYNVYTDPSHNFLCGSSSGGLEVFYIGMEHQDKFGTIGALSPAFELFSEDTWKNYLKGITVDENSPFIYIYCGNNDELEQFLYIESIKMNDYLKDIGYPKEKIVTKIYEEGIHNEIYWRAVFPDFLKYAFGE